MVNDMREFFVYVSLGFVLLVVMAFEVHDHYTEREFYTDFGDHKRKVQTALYGDNAVLLCRVTNPDELQAQERIIECRIHLPKHLGRVE